MTTPYKITPTILEGEGNIAKLEKDGHTRESIHKAMYDITDGSNTTQRTEIMKKLYKREPEQIKQTRWI